jgi:hypothetical protein
MIYKVCKKDGIFQTKHSVGELEAGWVECYTLRKPQQVSIRFPDAADQIVFSALKMKNLPLIFLLE